MRQLLLEMLYPHFKMAYPHGLGCLPMCFGVDFRGECRSKRRDLAKLG
jgi:hypothetical protein